MESEEINNALHRYVLAVLRARDASEGLAREQAKADNRSERFAPTDGERDSTGQPASLLEPESRMLRRPMKEPKPQ